VQVVKQLFQYLDERSMLCPADYAVLIPLNLLPQYSDYESDPADYGYREDYPDVFRSVADYEDEQAAVQWDAYRAALERRPFRSAGFGDWVGQSRKTWWKGFQVTQLAKARRVRAERGS